MAPNRSFPMRSPIMLQSNAAPKHAPAPVMLARSPKKPKTPRSTTIPSILPTPTPPSSTSGRGGGGGRRGQFAGAPQTITPRAATALSSQIPVPAGHHRTGGVLKLYPWRDGMRSTIKVLDQESAASTGMDPIHTVHVTFHEASLGRMNAPTTPKSSFKEIMNSSTWILDNQLIDLFESIGSDLPQMEHLTIQFVPIEPELRNNKKAKNRFNMKKSKAVPELPVGVAIPPVQAITSVLMESNRLQSISLIGLRLTGDKFDVNGLLEALRIHPRLEAFQMHGCWFTNEDILETLRMALSSSSDARSNSDVGSGSFSAGSDNVIAIPPPRLKHVDLSDNVVIDKHGKPAIYSPATTASSASRGSRDRELYDEGSQEEDDDNYESSNTDLDENVNTSNATMGISTPCAPLRMGSTSKASNTIKMDNSKGKKIEIKNKGGPTDRYFLEQEAKDQTKQNKKRGASVASANGAEEVEEVKPPPTSFLAWCMSPISCCQ